LEVNAVDGWWRVTLIMAITSNNTLHVDEIKIKLTPFLERALPLARLGIRVFPKS
jgi:hypothetical protein